MAHSNLADRKSSVHRGATKVDDTCNNASSITEIDRRDEMADRLTDRSIGRSQKCNDARGSHDAATRRCVPRTLAFMLTANGAA